MILMHCLRMLWRNGISQVRYGGAEQIVTSLSYSLFKAVNRVLDITGVNPLYFRAVHDVRLNPINEYL